MTTKAKTTTMRKEKENYQVAFTSPTILAIISFKKLFFFFLLFFFPPRYYGGGGTTFKMKEKKILITHT